MVEHSLGKGEVESSILSHSTISHFSLSKPPKTLKYKMIFGFPYAPSGEYVKGFENASLSTVWRTAEVPFCIFPKALRGT